MKIRNKLFLGFGLYTLLAVIFGLFAYKELGTVTKKLQLVELADDINNALLEVRRYEKNYLLYKDKDSVGELKSHLGILKADIDAIRAEIIEEIGKENFEMMRQSISEYEAAFNNLVENQFAQDRLLSLMRGSGRDIERELQGRDLQVFLVLRRHEKNLMLYKNEEARARFLETAADLRAKNEEIERYLMLVGKLYDLYRHENNSVEGMRAKARKIQSFTEDLSKREREDIGLILKRSMNLLLSALFALITIGIIKNIRITMSIVKPLKRLERLTKKVAMGDFSEVIEVSGEDEIASLESSFNQMEERLKMALESLEFTVTKLKEKQALLVEAEKLASIGILTAGIAHEINNPLTSVLTFSNLLLEQCPEDDPRKDKLKMMARETERARNIVRQLLLFSKDVVIKPSKMDINQTLREVADFLRAQDALNGIDLRLNLAEMPEIEADATLIWQVALNIIQNAVHAITPPGAIEIATRLEGGNAEIAFTDTGCGIPEEQLPKIFDPFYTTKETSRGTGLGLAVSYGIIKKHGGDIEVESKVGKGSTFRVRLPIGGSPPRENEYA